MNLGDITTERSDHANTTVWVADVLRSRIAAGELPPGAKLSEQQLAASMQVSRNTLRGAAGGAVELAELLAAEGYFD